MKGVRVAADASILARRTQPGLNGWARRALLCKVGNWWAGPGGRAWRRWLSSVDTGTGPERRRQVIQQFQTGNPAF